METDNFSAFIFKNLRSLTWTWRLSVENKQNNLKKIKIRPKQKWNISMHTWFDESGCRGYADGFFPFLLPCVLVCSFSRYFWKRRNMKKSSDLHNQNHFSYLFLASADAKTSYNGSESDLSAIIFLLKLISSHLHFILFANVNDHFCHYTSLFLEYSVSYWKFKEMYIIFNKW